MVERSPEKAGVGGSTPSLATIYFNELAQIVKPLQHSNSSRSSGIAGILCASRGIAGAQEHPEKLTSRRLSSASAPFTNQTERFCVLRPYPAGFPRTINLHMHRLALQPNRAYRVRYGRSRDVEDRGNRLWLTVRHIFVPGFRENG